MLFFIVAAAGPELDVPLLGFSFFGLGAGAPGEIENTVSAGALGNALGRANALEGSVRFIDQRTVRDVFSCCPASHQGTGGSLGPFGCAGRMLTEPRLLIIQRDLRHAFRHCHDSNAPAAEDDRSEDKRLRM